NDGRYFSRIGQFTLNNNDSTKYELKPELRFYTSRDQFTTKADIKHSWLNDYYITIGEILNSDNPQELIDNPQLAVRIYYRPGIMLIWLGGVIVALASFVRVIQLTKFASARYV
ncbi:MAG: cytochrome c-type biogenesis CcmF C-terminal domain-containing protein, partial [Pseudomonadota bacterium]